MRGCKCFFSCPSSPPMSTVVHPVCLSLLCRLLFCPPPSVHFTLVLAHPPDVPLAASLFLWTCSLCNVPSVNPFLLSRFTPATRPVWPRYFHGHVSLCIVLAHLRDVSSVASLFLRTCAPLPLRTALCHGVELTCQALRMMTA